MKLGEKTMPIYMKYEGITGTGTGKYNGWIVLESCGLAQFAKARRDHEIFVTRLSDNASSQLFGESVKSEGKKVTIDFVDAGKSVPWLSIELENVMISSYSFSGSGGDRPMESLSLNFTKITLTNKPTAPTKDPKNAQEKTTWNFAVHNSRYYS
ncbi:MAG: type VI secretion system tube protein Hcp [Acidobacteriota bacterium]